MNDKNNKNLVCNDKNLVCNDCDNQFVFTVEEQTYYKEKGFENDPVRCPECRKARKVKKQQKNYRKS